MDFFHLHTYGYIFVWFIIYSFFGWVYESLWASFNEKQWVNRGFLSGPIIPIYGAGAVLFVLLLENIENPVVIFLLGMVIASILEYFTSWAMEKLFHARWWDYHHYPFNLNGRINLFHSILWGLLGILFYYLILPMIEQINIKSKKVKVLLVIISCIFVIDCTISALACYRQKERRKNSIASNKIEVLLDKHYPDEFLNKVYNHARIPKN